MAKSKGNAKLSRYDLSFKVKVVTTGIEKRLTVAEASSILGISGIYSENLWSKGG